MKLLLDTHVILWWLRDDPKLGRKTRAMIADANVSPMVSIASFWELSIKARNGKIADAGSRLYEEVLSAGFTVLHLLPHHLAKLEMLERVEGHNDPFDHLMIAQARAEQATLVTSDRKIQQYAIRNA
jgi:PIN domain nuclease of toxin-antitoxin system